MCGLATPPLWLLPLSIYVSSSRKTPATPSPMTPLLWLLPCDFPNTPRTRKSPLRSSATRPPPAASSLLAHTGGSFLGGTPTVAPSLRLPQHAVYSLEPSPATVLPQRLPPFWQLSSTASSSSPADTSHSRLPPL
jgi:hypothetical protein